MKETELLRDLFHRRWAMPTLAALHRWRGAKFVTLYKTLDASAGAMRTTVDELASAGFVVKNPGYGHPMRPEYILTKRGQRVGVACDDLLKGVDEANARKTALSKWAMPVLYSLRSSPLKFTEIREQCPGLTDRALTQTLKLCQGTGLIEREVAETYPPTAIYSLSMNGRSLLQHLSPLVESLHESGHWS